MSCSQSVSDQRNYIGSRNYSQVFLYHDLSFITNFSCAWAQHRAREELAGMCPWDLSLVKGPREKNELENHFVQEASGNKARESIQPEHLIWGNINWKNEPKR